MKRLLLEVRNIAIAMILWTLVIYSALYLKGLL